MGRVWLFSGVYEPIDLIDAKDCGLRYYRGGLVLMLTIGMDGITSGLLCLGL